MRQQPLYPAVTVLCTVLLVGLSIWLHVTPGPREHLDGLHYPGESAGRMVERHLDFYEGYGHVPTWQQAFYTFLFGSRQQVQMDSVHIYREVLHYFAAHPRETTAWSSLNTRARLLVTLAEAGDWNALDQALAHFDNSPEEDVIRDAVLFAYTDRPVAASPDEILTGVQLLPLGWAADHLQLRIAQKMGEPRREAWVKRRLDARGAQARERVLLLAGLVAAVLFSGFLVWWRWHPARPPAWDTGALVRPWRFGEGFGVTVRAALLGVGISVAFAMFAQSYFRPGMLALWSTLFASLPLLWLVHRYLLRPRGLTLVSAFGLSLRGVGGLRLARITLAVLALEWCGTLCIAWLGWKVGLESHWSEGLYERAIFGPWQTTVLGAVNTVVWAPLFEEIGFRGLIYTTLRSRLAPWLAIVLSAVLFSALHMYSLAGFLAVFWSGMVLAWAYERYRSLLPGMLVHAAGNLLAIGTVVLFYR